MGRAQRRAEDRERAKQERTSQLAARKPSGDKIPRLKEENPETSVEATRRVLRDVGERESGAKKGRRAVEKPLKWREGRQ
jgi:hypothetical protein